MGSIIVDLIIILIFAISILIAYLKGIASILYNIISWLLVVVCVCFLYEPITNIIIDKTGYDEFISEKVESNLDGLFEDGELIDTEDSNISNSFINIINEYVEEANEANVTNVEEYVADEISYMIVSVTVMVVIFIFVKVIMFLVQFVLEFIVSLPFIRSFNKFIGIIYGVIRAFLLIYIILAVLSLVSPLLSNTEIISCIKASNIGSIFYNDNIILDFLKK